MLFFRNFNGRRLVLVKARKVNKWLDNPGLVQKLFFCSGLWGLGPFCHFGLGPNYNGSIARILLFFFLFNRIVWGESERWSMSMARGWNKWELSFFLVWNKTKRSSGQSKCLSKNNFFLGIKEDSIGFRKGINWLSTMYQMPVTWFYLILNLIRYNYYVDFLQRMTLRLRKLHNLSKVTQLVCDTVFSQWLQKEYESR